MDKSEFETLALANPDNTSQDFLDALNEDPTRQQFLDEAKTLNQRLNTTLNNIPVPDGLASKLKEIAGEAESNVVPLHQGRFSFRGFALAASLVLALGVTYSVLFRDSGPSSAEIAFGQQIIEHIYMELDQLDSEASVNFQTVSQAIGSVGGQMRGTESVDNLHINFAKPCNIIPENNSVHLALQGTKGAVNVIVINNSPVQAEFTLNDKRFKGVVIPMGKGNLILIGEKEESLNNYRELLAKNVDWVI
ncbi:MAG: DUF3379 family protein [Gammaproteobacteria bacterium]|nr:DUF3379 family protein [Gammaproteobacteria bacterium]